jgi:hypothetical protein
MTPAAAHPVHANVAFLRIPQFESRSVAEQAAAKERLEERVRRSLAAIPPGERAVLEAEEGIAIVHFGEPSRALDLALAVHAAPKEAPLQVGLNYGPLALTSAGSEGRVFGDGLSGAATAARFARPESLLVTESFNKALEASAPDRASELVHAGEFTDSRVRMHEFFAPDPARRALRRRRLALFAVGGSILILLLGVLGRDIYQPLFQTRPAVLALAVKPRGEVFVDGVSRGRVPPLTEIEVAPGQRHVVIRNGNAKPLELHLELKAGERRTISHVFPRPPPPPKPDFWRDLKKKFS